MKKVFLVVCIACLGFLGCSGTNGAYPPVGERDHDHTAIDTHHDHAEHGPHGGELIELGNGKYHAEVLHSQKSVEVFILDEAMRVPTVKLADQVAISLRLNDSIRQFTVAADWNSLDGDATERRYVSKDADLIASLEDESAVAKLRVAIDGRSYSGELVHDHDHGPHSHDSHMHEQANNPLKRSLR